jgi:hypothetical protein
MAINELKAAFPKLYQQIFALPQILTCRFGQDPIRALLPKLLSEVVRRAQSWFCVRSSTDRHGRSELPRYIQGADKAPIPLALLDIKNIAVSSGLPE